MRDQIAVALMVAWLVSPFAALGVFGWHYRREAARDRRVCWPAEDFEADLPELDELVWGWPDRP